MVKIIVLIECNTCSGVLQKIAVATEPHSLLEEIHELQLAAENDSWELRRNSTVHYCSDCCVPA